jgi:hypothetical protein
VVGVAVEEDEALVEIAKGAVQLPVAAMMPFAASPFAESKNIHLSSTKQ